MSTAKLGLTYLTTNILDPSLPINENLMILDALVPHIVVDKDLVTPPTTTDADAGKVWIVGPAATGRWSGKAGQLAVWRGVNSEHYIVPTEGYSVFIIDEDLLYRYNGSAWTTAAGAVVPIMVAASDETTALTTGTNKVKFRNPYSTVFNITAVKASLSTAQASGGLLTVDINEGASSILSTKLTFDNTETTTTTAATPPVISDASIAADAEMSIDIDSLGDGTAKGLKVTIMGYPS